MSLNWLLVLKVIFCGLLSEKVRNQGRSTRKGVGPSEAVKPQAKERLVKKLKLDYDLYHYLVQRIKRQADHLGIKRER